MAIETDREYQQEERVILTGLVMTTEEGKFFS